MKTKGKRMLVMAGIFFFSTASVFADGNEKGIEYYRAELYEAAKIFFLQQKNQSVSEQAENFYYLGQTYYQLAREDSARYYYQKAINTDPEYPFGYIGEGHLELKKGNIKLADDLFKKASSLAKKDPSVQSTIAEIYISVDQYDKANEALGKARKIKKTFSGIYLVEGDMLMKQGKVGEANPRYENAILYNESDKLSYLKLAQVYKKINPKAALNYLNKLITIDPNYIPAYALIGDINREDGKYEPALAAYEKFISIQGVPLLQHERYAQLLYFTKQYAKSLEHINYILAIDPENSVMYRLQAYNNYELENAELALKQMNAFFEKTPQDRLIYMDYITYGRLLLKDKQYKQALEALLKAEAIDNTKAEIYKELASACEAGNDYAEAVKYHEKYLELEPNKKVLDYLYYGTANYYAASKFITQKDPEAVEETPEQKSKRLEEMNVFIKKGDEAFAEVINRSPDSFHGYFWRARINSFIDYVEQLETGTNEGHALPHYEAALKIMLDLNTNGSMNSSILEIYNYLGSYYYAKKDFENALKYYSLILEITPENEGVKVTVNELKKK